MALTDRMFAFRETSSDQRGRVIYPVQQHRFSWRSYRPVSHRSSAIVASALFLAMLPAAASLRGAESPRTDAAGSNDVASMLDRPYMNWFRESRYGMFIHFGPFSQYYKHDDWQAFSTKPEGMSQDDFDRRFVKGLTPKKGCARDWARLAKRAGMRYMVFTTKHHEGFSLWDTKLTDYNSVRIGPGFDMVREFADACREAGLKVGFYFSLGDMHHPDGKICKDDEAARGRFLEFTRGQLRELMTNYGTVDILWYDGPFPLGCADEWESEKMNRMVRSLQPGIIINDRALRTEDFTCSEGRIEAPAFPNQDWEACMTFNGTWGWRPTPLEQYVSTRRIIDMFREVSSMSGNLLLNVGPNPDDGSVGEVETRRLLEAGQWLEKYGEAFYGHLDRVYGIGATKNSAGGGWSRRGNTVFLWLPDWPKEPVAIENLRARIVRCALMPGGPELPFTQEERRATIRGLPESCPDSIGQYAMIKIELASYPR